jgi:2-polyprenyl-6-methoxyphenol hydroxylase-like FAD-dependent oxidoreductase
VTQHSDTSRATDVIVIGGGPVGLCMVLQLAMYGIRSVLVEAAAETRWHPKGNTNNARTVEIFRRLGIADAVRGLGVPADHPFDVAFFTRYNAFEIARGRTPSQRERLALRELAPATHQVAEPPHRANQMYLERLLFERATALPEVTLKFGCTAEAFVQDSDGVAVTVTNADAKEEIWRGRYIVGCDGSRGVVRRMLGIKYGGEEQLMNVFMSGLFTSVHLRIPDLLPKFLGRRRAWMYVALNVDAQVIMISLNGRDEFMMHIPTRDGRSLDEAAVRARVRHAIGADIPVELVSRREWNAGAYLVADRYQFGRAFLAGDSAHLYTPTGGFGLNTGVDDTGNLAWKLAAVLHGWGGVRLLDSYEAERRPVALRSVNVSRNLGKARMNVEIAPVTEEDSPAGAAARDALARSEFITTNHFILPEERDWLGVILGGRYDGSPVIVADGATPPDSLEEYVPSDLPGGRAPHVWLDRGRGPGSSLYDRLGPGLTLLRLGDRPADATALTTAAQTRGIPLHVVDVTLAEASELYRRQLYLVRPDHYIAWRGDALPDDVDSLLAVVTGASDAARPSAQRTPSFDEA